MTIMRVEALQKAFHGQPVVKGISFRLNKGEMLAMIGPNGAGKSTTFNMIGGQLKPDRGQVWLDDHPITGVSVQRLARLGVGRTFQVAQSFVSMSVVENVQMGLIAHFNQAFDVKGAARGLHRDDALAALMRVGLAEKANLPVRELSYGDVKRVELAMALCQRPKLLLMDEPTAGMAQDERQALMRLVQSLVDQQGLAVLFTEHDMEAVFGFADRIIVLVDGQIIAEGSAADIENNEAVKRLYLGGFHAA